MKLSRKKLRQLIIETMITPSNLLQRILQDPQIDSKIKSELKIALADNDQETINQLLEFVTIFNPGYAQEIDTVQTSVMMLDYQKEFDDTAAKHKLTRIENTIQELKNNYESSTEFRFQIRKDGFQFLTRYHPLGKVIGISTTNYYGTPALTEMRNTLKNNFPGLNITPVRIVMVEDIFGDALGHYYILVCPELGNISSLQKKTQRLFTTSKMGRNRHKVRYDTDPWL